MNNLQVINFHGDEIQYIKDKDGKYYIPLKRISENIGLKWKHEHARIMTDSVLSDSILKFGIKVQDTNSSRVRNIEMVCLPLDMLNGYLFGVPITKRTNEFVKEKLIKYKKECYRTLWEEFNNEEAKWKLSRSASKKISRDYTDVLADLLKKAVEQGSKNYANNDKLIYMNYTKMLNNIVFGISGAGELLGDNPRDYASIEQLNTITFCMRCIKESINKCLESGTPYKEIYQEAKKLSSTLLNIVGETKRLPDKLPLEKRRVVLQNKKIAKRFNGGSLKKMLGETK